MVCNSGHVLLDIRIKEYEIFVLRVKVERRVMNAELQLRSEANGHIDDLGIV